MGKRYRLKRPFDYLVALVGVFVSIPAWILISYAVWLQDYGPIFFTQERVGFRGKIFMGYKFRSMIRDAERYTGPIQAQEGDKRITRVGMFLRKTALDELPQLWNILKGDMPFVGPRPLRPAEIEVGKTDSESLTDIQYAALRTSIMPGLTGVAQVFASRTVTREEKFKYDLWYKEHQSLAWDIRLIAVSFWISFCRKWDTKKKGFERVL